MTLKVLSLLVIYLIGSSLAANSFHCEVCKAVLKETSKKIASLPSFKSRGRRESEILNIVETICSKNNYVIYEYSPPKMSQGCEEFMLEHDEEIEKEFLPTTFSLSDVEKRMCAGLCDEVNKSFEDHEL